MPELLQSIVHIGLNVLQILLQILLQNVQVITTIMSNVIEVTPLPSTDSARFAVKLALSSRSTSSSKNRFLLTSAASCASSSIAAGCVALRCQPSLLSTRSRNWTSAVRLPRDPGATMLRGPRKVFLPYISGKQRDRPLDSKPSCAELRQYPSRGQAVGRSRRSTSAGIDPRSSLYPSTDA